MPGEGNTNPLFGPSGSLYVYLVYGRHWMLNVVTGDIGYPAAVLVPSVETITGPERLTPYAT
jgi:DNA-3-methyladenine glycosylase